MTGSTGVTLCNVRPVVLHAPIGWRRLAGVPAGIALVLCFLGALGETEIELWSTLRERGTTVIGSTSKRSALAVADQVLVVEQGQVVASGTWAELAPRFGAPGGLIGETSARRRN